MSVTPYMPMKFECARCNKIYLRQYENKIHTHYPNCPRCEQPGLLLGIAVLEDLLKHPQSFVRNFFKQTLHKLNKLHW
ncbi:hypothetical protein DYI96_06280 [Acinetobacter sp. SWAC57]|nr:hypothetical protein [Acinetobacter sp. SWAC57]RGD92140.1 hypothetical protein DYI96_06280 [Acinetobacter sp. SWAC57]